VDAAMVTAIAAVVVGALSAVGVMYGSRGANRAAREGNAVTIFNSLTDQLQEERLELKKEVATLRAELAAEKLEAARLRLLVQQLGGAP
jgi:acid phosphatase family membrane protein YuiD